MWWLIFLAVFIVVVVYYVNKLNKSLSYWKEKNIPYIKPWPIIGNMWKFVGKGMCFPDWLQTVYYTYDARYFGIYQFMQPVLLIKDLELIKQIGIKDFDHFVDHKSFFVESHEPVFGRNLLALRGEEWHRMRATLSPAFTSSKMRAMFVFMANCAEQFTNYFVHNVDPHKPMTIKMKDIFSRYTNDVIATCAFGIKCDSVEEKNNDFYLKGKEISDFGGIRGLKFTGFMFCPALMNYFNIKLFSKEEIDFFRDIMNETVRIREREGIVRPDMIHLLMEARKGKLNYEESSKHNDAGFATVQEYYTDKGNTSKKMDITDEDFVAQILTFFIAGFETSSTTITFLSYELAMNESVQKKLQMEIDNVMEACNGNIKYEEILTMKYLDRVLSESLRKWPPVFFHHRMCVKPYTIKPKNPDETPVHIDINDVIWFPAYSIQRDPKYFPNPDLFDPERFSEENRDKIEPLSYMPFGVGPRNCIASRFALLEIKALIVHLLWKFEFVVVEKTQIPVKVDPKQMFLNAEDGVYLGLKRRNNC